MRVLARGYQAHQPDLEAAAHEIVRSCELGLVLELVPVPAAERHVEHCLVVAAERPRTAAAAGSRILGFA